MTSAQGLPAIEERTLRHAFDRVLATAENKEYLRFQNQSWSFREAFEKAKSFGAGLRERGVESQQPVGLLLDNSSDFVFAWLGIALHRMIEVPVNTALRGRFLAHVINDSGVEVLVIESEYVERLLLIEHEVPNLKQLVIRGGGYSEQAARRFAISAFEDVFTDSEQPLEATRPNDIIGYMYTSGTTGPSKGVATSHVHAYTYSSQEDSSFVTSDDVILVTLPIFHLAGQWGGTYASLIHQTTCVLEPRFSATSFWPTVVENGITSTVLLGAQAEILQQQAPGEADSRHSLKIASMAPLPSNLSAFTGRFGIAARPVYGMSEIGRVLEGRDTSDTRPGEAGMTRAGYQLRIVDENGRDVEAGVPGELLVKPEHPLMVMSGYHNLPQKTAEMIDSDGWVHTGDVFRMDEDGHFYFLDRMKDALRRRGENISSFEVESSVNEHPAVLESAVVGVPSEMSEDEIKAFIVLREGEEVDPVELTRFLAERMPYFMVPRYLEFVAELPKTPTHKIQKAVLRNLGINDGTWDREQAGITVTREGVR
ncbi:ATP-dependent acyl-CoA ligase [Brevibacterium daeguense]|uniref:ATP-dependent acyl-CoA ligase n=1 Tax=Brevibacterium daeguense TaxID=909936 RepID=A0ABP8EFU7_9MICO|nr:AMP-binding protein [Brevibacterium daeguense]